MAAKNKKSTSSAKSKTTKSKTASAKKSTRTAKAPAKSVSEPTGLYTAGLVLGIIGVVFAFIPMMYWLAYILGGLALIFGIVGLVKKASGHKALTATILGAVSIVVAIAMNVMWVNFWSGAINLIEGWGTEILDDWDYDSNALGKTVDVTLGEYQEVNDFWSKMGVPVTITNISDKKLSFSINIEALDENGNRIDESYVSADSLEPGQSVVKNAFTLSSLGEDTLMKATYRIYRASSY